MKQQSIGIDRLVGAELLSAKAKAIGNELGAAILDCVRNIGDDLEHEHAHRLENITATKTERLYFPDLELTTSDKHSRTMRSENRLRQAVSNLVAREPAPTYAFR